MKTKYFGTDGIRDVLTGPLMDEKFIRKLGFGVGRYLKEKHPDKSSVVLIGRDTRASGGVFEPIIAEGLIDEGYELSSIGVMPTPAVAQGVLERSAALGIVLTASHNPAEYNGIKLFNHLGMKLTVEEECLVESYIDAAVLPDVPKKAGALLMYPFMERYCEKQKAILADGSLDGWKIVLDTANGATCETSTQVLGRLGVQLMPLGDHPNGTNINDGFGSECPEKMASAVLDVSAAIGIAHDGDGDRMIVSDEKGSVLDGDEVLAILALDYLERDALKANTLVVTILSNKALDIVVEAAGGKIVRTDVGDRHVLYAMHDAGACLGGEASGHIICLDHATTGDGLVSVLNLIAVMLRTGKPLSELRKQISLFPVSKKNIKVAEKKPLESLNALLEAKQAAEVKLAGRGQVLVRYSGTEPKIRLHVEAEEKETADAILSSLEDAVHASLEVV